MEKVLTLERRVVSDHPVVFLTHEGLHDGRCNIGVIKAAEAVANIVQQRANDVLLVLSVAMREGGRLQAVRESIDRKAAMVTVE